MIIRSQDKKYLVNMGNISIYAMDREVICFDTSGIEDSGYISLGYYETEEKALKVLDMIQEAYAEVELTKLTIPEIGKTFKEAPATEENELLAKAVGEVLRKKMVFQMPEDSEVEV